MNLNIFSAHTRATSNIPTQQLSIMPMRMITSRPAVTLSQLNTPSIIPQQITVSQQETKKVIWGEPIWYLFHTISVKVKESEFQRIRVDLLNHIYAICTNLPCPECSNHAKTYLDGINFNSIQSPTDLKIMLHAFHNNVNRRKGYPYFPYEEVDEKYSKAITTNIIRVAMLAFSDRVRSKKLLATDLFRARLTQSLKVWFNENINCFDQ